MLNIHFTSFWFLITIANIQWKNYIYFLIDIGTHGYLGGRVSRANYYYRLFNASKKVIHIDTRSCHLTKISEYFSIQVLKTIDVRVFCQKDGLFFYVDHPTVGSLFFWSPSIYDLYFLLIVLLIFDMLSFATVLLWWTINSQRNYTIGVTI